GSPTRGRGSTGLAGSRRAADRHECARGWGKRLSGGGNGRLRRAPCSSAGKRSRRRGARRLERRRRGRPWTVALRRGARPPALGLAAAARRAPEVSRVWLRAAALALVVIGVVVALTVYFSSESTPPCLVSGAATWRPPSDGGTHRYEVVFRNAPPASSPSMSNKDSWERYVLVRRKESQPPHRFRTMSRCGR